MIEIRFCDGVEELDACVRLEIETWGYDATEIIPRKTFLLAQKIGGQVMGAFETASGAEEKRVGGQRSEPKLAGFAMSLPGVKSVAGRPVPYLHSHMLAVSKNSRNQGLGTRLKKAQRLEALARGIRLMEWTFDPLEIKNAFLNIHRLGAVVRSYRPDFYGVSSSRLQGGLPTDRLLAEWALDSPRVEAILEGRPEESARIVEERIVIPAAIAEWKATESERDRARAVQQANGDRFQAAFARGLAVIGFTRDAEANGIFELGRLIGTE